MLRNGNSLGQPMPMFNPSVPPPSPTTAASIMHHLHPLPSLNFSPHDFFQAHQAMQSLTRHRFHPYPPRREEHPPRMECPRPPPVFKTPVPPPPPRRLSASSRRPSTKTPPSSSPPALPLPSPSNIDPTPTGIINPLNPFLLGGGTLEHPDHLSKPHVDELLRLNRAVVVLDHGKRLRSDVWLYMGRVQIIESGLLVKEWVGCIGCQSTFSYKTKSQGTSTLRNHKCEYVFRVLEAKKQKDLADRWEKMAEENVFPRDYQKEHISQHWEQYKKLAVADLVKVLGKIPLPTAPGEATPPGPVVGRSPMNCNMSWQQGEGRHQQRELTPEGEDRKPVMPTPPPLKEHIMNSPSPQSVHPVSLHQATPVSSVLGSGSLVNNVGGSGRGSNSSTGGCASPPPPTSKDNPPQQLLCVRWGNFDSNIVSMFSKLRNQEHFVDVTLWCEGKTIKCHKMILSACSMYFEKLLTEVPNPHPVIFLKDMRFWEIQALVEFMYRGEVSVHQEKLQNLLRAAESLQIKGLGSPSNEMGMPMGDAQNSMDDDISNSTMDMTTTSSLNNSSHLQNHLSASMKEDNGPNSNGSSNNGHSISHLLDAAVSAVANKNSNNNNHSGWQKFVSAASANAMMGIDLSNHSAASGALSLSSLHGSNLPLPLSLSAGSPQSGTGSQGSGCGQAAKRRKKETPRRIDLPRTAGMPLPAFNSTMGSEIEEDDDAASEDSMAAHERNHVDGLKSDMQQDQSYGDEEDLDNQEQYDENDQGLQGEDDISSDHGEEMDEDQDGALSLRVNNLSDSERMDRERSRKGNPMKKILGIGNNNNNNESGPQNLIHNVSTGGD